MLIANHNLPKQNQFDETIALFRDIVGLPCVNKMPLILLLNKTDCLKEKMGRILENHWPDYAGSQDFDYATMVDFLRDKLLAENKSQRDVHVFPLCGIDHKQVTRTMRKVSAVIALAHSRHRPLPTRQKGCIFTRSWIQT